MTDASEGVKLRQEVLLAEFKGLRDEIQYRTTAQNMLTNIQLVASAALAALIVREDAGRALALVLAPVSAATGLLWLDHARAINKIGSYIRETLWPALRDRSGTGLPTYEEHKEQNPDKATDKATAPHSAQTSQAAAPQNAGTGQVATQEGTETGKPQGWQWRRQGGLILTFPFSIVFVLPAGIGVVAPLVSANTLDGFVLAGSLAALVPVIVLFVFWWRTLKRLLPAEA